MRGLFACEQSRNRLNILTLLWYYYARIPMLRLGVCECRNARVHTRTFALVFVRCTTLLRSLHHPNKHTQAVPTELPSVHHRGTDRWYDNTWRVARTARASSLLQNRGIRIPTRMSLPIGRYALDVTPIGTLFLPVAVSMMRFKRSSPRLRMTRARASLVNL